MLHLLNHKLTLVMLIVAVFGYCYRIAVQTICSEWCSSFGIANLAVGIQLAAANCGGKDHNDRSCLVGCILTTMGISLSSRLPPIIISERKKKKKFFFMLLSGDKALFAAV